MNKRHKILFVFGTRPEALKLAPVINAAKRDKRFRTVVCLTAQHREMVDQVLRLFKTKTDFDLDLMEKGQSLSDLTQKLFAKVHHVIETVKPELIIVQGDTTSAFAVALKAFYEKIPVGYVEAGLRSFNKYQPFPEEVNRVLISHVADYQFAPTEEARQNLLREGISDDKIFVTGNTIVDALKIVREELGDFKSTHLTKLPKDKKIILVTAHRRENLGKPLRSICLALRDLASKFPDVAVVYPVHLNPAVQMVAEKELKGRKNIFLLPPLSYEEFLHLMNRSFLILTDSGGIQEEAPSMGKPVLVLREVTERPDGVALGVAKLVGNSRKKIFEETAQLLSDPAAYARMIEKPNPYGDGKASERILDILHQKLKKEKEANRRLLTVS